MEDFEVWYGDCHPRLLGSLFLLCGDLEVARDVVDETCTRAFERWSRVGRMESPTGWAYVVGMRELRRRQGRRRRERDLIPRVVEPDLPAGAIELWSLLDGLAPRQRTAVVLRHVADLTEADVAAAMRVTRSTVSNTLRDAYRNLRAMLEAADEEKPDARTPELDAAVDRFLGTPLGEPSPVADVRQRAQRRTTRRRARTAIGAVVIASVAAVGIADALDSGHGSLDVKTRASAPTTVPVSDARLSLAPSPRRAPSAAFDATTGTVVLFGGSGPYGSLADTWTWDGARWHQEHPRTSPPARDGAAMAYDPISKQVLMTGGEASVPLTDPCDRSMTPPLCTPPSSFRSVPLAGDLWGWNGHDWHRLLDQAQQPRPLAMATDDAVGRVVLLREAGGALDTFTWSGSAWIYRRPGTLPRNENETGMAFDAALGKVVAIQTHQQGVCMPHAGCTAPARTIAAVWDGDAWTALAVSGAPSQRAGLLRPTTLTTDPAGRGLLALDDHDNTWRLRNQRWARVTTAEHSPRRQGMAIVGDPAHHRVVTFGGYPTGSKAVAFPSGNDTWIWNGSTWRRYTAPVTATNPPAPPAPQACTLNGPAFIPSVASSDASAVRFMVSDLFVTPPCHLTVTVRLTLVDAAGQPLVVDGNPASATFDATATASVLTGGFTWTLPCAPSGGVRAVFTETGAGAWPDPFPVDVPAPSCTIALTSRLTADPLTVGAGG